MTYKQWLEGDCGCGNVSPCSHKDVCDCENILLELEKQHVDDLTLQDEIDYVSGVVETISGCTGGSVIVDEELSLTSTNPVQNKVITGALNDKLDSSAYTPTDLSDYYTKEEVNELIPSLSSYATKQWVLEQGFVTNSELIQYITNLQQQINSLTSAISGCCGESGETQYRWVTMTGENDYWCSGTTKMSEEKQQSSTDGIVWSDTGNIRSGNTVLEENCVDCGYVPVVNKLTITKTDNTQYILPCDGDGMIHQLGIDNTTIREINIGNCVYRIGGCVFSASTNLTAVTIPDTVTIMGYELFKGCTSLTNISIPSGVTKIDTNMFEGCSALTTVSIPGARSIESDVFWNCSSLQDITIPSGVTKIGTTAFRGCASLTSIVIPSSVASIGYGAFSYCGSLASITVESLTPPTLGSNAFFNSNNCQIYVPASSVETYKTASGWSDYADRIQAIS